jgi:hypothetical protein
LRYARFSASQIAISHWCRQTCRHWHALSFSRLPDRHYIDTPDYANITLTPFSIPPAALPPAFISLLRWAISFSPLMRWLILRQLRQMKADFDIDIIALIFDCH